MLHQKRTTLAVGGALCAALALTGCGQAGYGAPGTSAELRPAVDPGGKAAEPAAKPAASKPARNVEGKLTDELIAKRVPRMGNVVTDAKGWILYRFDNDTATPESVSNCAGECAKVWPPLLTKDGNPQLTGVSAAKVGSIRREDGSRQVTIGGWPVYRYIGDKKAGTWKGQAVGGTWFVVDKNGKKNLTCLPKGTPKAVEPPADESSGDSGESAGVETYDSGSGGY